ncbi:MAG: hypothetical protein N2Z40_06870 [Caldimicrobium sp.]|nr:hypothetical protein [Caldimicrobium sp.]
MVEHKKKVRDISEVERLLRLKEEPKAMREFEERRFEAINTPFESLEKRLGFL